MNQVVANKFRLLRKIGSGSFGEIFLAEDIDSNKKVAIKLESLKARIPQLLFESKLYRILEGGISIPRVYHYSSEASSNVLAIELLGKSLENIFTSLKKPLSLKSVLMIADQMISSLEFIHKKHFILEI